MDTADNTRVLVPLNPITGGIAWYPPYFSGVTCLVGKRCENDIIEKGEMTKCAQRQANAK